MATSITVAQARSYEQNPSQIPAGTVFDIIDTSGNIDTLTATDISNFSSLLSVTTIVSTDGPVTFTPGGPEQAALQSAGITIDAHVSVSGAISLDVQYNMSGGPTLVPPGENLIVVDTAANLETLTPRQISDLGKAVDTATAAGKDSGTSAVTEIAGTNAPPVFTTNQINALSRAGIAIVAPGANPGQNDGTTVIAGRGMTFDITWDSSVASAPAAFKIDVDEAFQLLADTYSSPVTLHFHVGFGEVDGSALGSDDLGESSYDSAPQESYSDLVSQLTSDATSPAQLQALSTLPATSPTNGTYYLSQAQAETLGFANAGASSDANPDGYVGFSSDTSWNYSADPNQTPVSGEWDFLGTVEHELTEILGRGSFMGDSTNETFTNQYSLMDLYRFSGDDTRALRPHNDPSYFSIDDGATDLADFNNYKTGDNGDLGDWSGTTVNGTLVHTPDSFDDESDGGGVNPFTATDATLMNVLGYNFATPPLSPIPLTSSDIILSAGQLMMNLTLDQINPGSVDPPAGDSYVVIDSAFDIESLTAPEITQALSIGVSEFIVDGAIAFLQGSDPNNDQITALGNTPFIAALTAAEAVSYEANPPTLPPNETVIVSDTAAKIEALTSSEVAGLGTIGVAQIDVSDLSGTGPLIVQDGYTYAVHGAVTADETIDFTGAGGTLELDDTPGMKGTISGFASGDRIVLSDIADDPNGSADLVANNVLDVTENGVTHTLQLDPTQDFAGDFFHLFADPTAGTDIVENTTPCYCPGTLILAERGEVPVEKLEIGDLVMTRSGMLRPIKWIGRRGYSGRFVLGRKDILPVCIKADALGENMPRRDLWISPHHAMYFQGDFPAADAACRDGVLIEAKDLVNGATIVQAESIETIEYFHIELDTHDVIIAEGAMSESFIDDDSRGMFHNAQEFYVLYPDAAGNKHYCVPRLDTGYLVEAVRQAIAQRAGLLLASATSPGAVRGSVDAIAADAIEGWAQNDNEPEAPVCLDIFIGGRCAGQALANRFREDLAAAGIGRGYHAFRFELPSGQRIGNAAVDVRRSLDGERLA